MKKSREEKVSGAGVFIDVGDCEHTGLARVRPPRAEKLSEGDSEAVRAYIEAPDFARPLHMEPAYAWPKSKGPSKVKQSMARLGISSKAMTDIKENQPEYFRALISADAWRKQRMTEYSINHGHVSAGVGALLASSALALASSRFLYETAARTGNFSLLQQASKLATEHRQTELSAWELCAREGIARKKAAAALVGSPWLSGEQVTAPSLPQITPEEAAAKEAKRAQARAERIASGKRGPGRPRKIVQQIEPGEMSHALDGLLTAGGGQTDGTQAAGEGPSSSSDSGESGRS